jgi:hypothetical protein
LAASSRASAIPMSVVASSPSSGDTATPAEQVMVTTAWMRSGIGVAETVWRISSSLAAASTTLVSMKASANSSPPNRAQRSLAPHGPRQPRRHLAQHLVAGEMAAVSLTRLN